MTTNVYLVVAEEVESSEYSTWIVAAYTSREQAQAHIDLIMTLHKPVQEAWEAVEKARNENRRQDVAELWEQYDNLRDGLVDNLKKSGLDPRAEYNAEGIVYKIKELPLFRHVDEFLEQPAKISD